jgi:hypothetical protein
MDRGLRFSHISQLPFDDLSESGRGVFLVTRMADDFTVSPRPDGGSHVRAVLIGRLPRSLQAEDVLSASTLSAFTWRPGPSRSLRALAGLLRVNHAASVIGSDFLLL